MTSWSLRRSAHLALSLLAAIPALASVLPRQSLPDVLICTCSSKAKALSRISGICRAAGGDEALITVFAEANAENAGYPPTASWNECYIPGKFKEKATATFTDENCAARFGEGFTGDCVPYPRDPGFENIHFPPPPYCKKGRDALPNCPLTGLNGCGTNPFYTPPCCLEIQAICGVGPGGPFQAGGPF